MIKLVQIFEGNERHCPVCQHLVLRHLLQGDKLKANNRPCLLYEFIQSVCILCFAARTPRKPHQRRWGSQQQTDKTSGASSCRHYLLSFIWISISFGKAIAILPGVHTQHNNLFTAVHIERPEPPQEVKLAQALLVDCLCVCSTLQVIVQHHTQVFV